MGGARRNGADLRIADQRVSSFEDMSLMSLRELFKGEKREGARRESAERGCPPLSAERRFLVLGPRLAPSLAWRDAGWPSPALYTFVPNSSWAHPHAWARF